MQSLVSLRLAQEHATREADTPAGAARSAHARLDRAATEAPSRAWWECRRGCAYCCHLQVLVTPPEAAVLAPFLTDEIRARIETNAERAAGLDAGEYRRARIPCAFLDADGGCLVYEARPLRCRAHSSTNVRVCQSAFEDDTPTDAVPTDPWLRQAATAIQSGLVRDRHPAETTELHASLSAHRRLLAGPPSTARLWRMGKFALGCIAAFVLIGLLVGGVAMFAFSTFNDQMQELISKNPVVVEHLGTVEDVEFDVVPSKEDRSEHAGMIILQVTGSKASGVLYLKPSGDKENPGSWEGELKLESSETFPVVLEPEKTPDAAGTPDATTPKGTTPEKGATPDAEETPTTPTESATPSGTTPTEKTADPAPEEKKEPAGAPK